MIKQTAIYSKIVSRRLLRDRQKGGAKAHENRSDTPRLSGFSGVLGITGRFICRIMIRPNSAGNGRTPLALYVCEESRNLSSFHMLVSAALVHQSCSMRGRESYPQCQRCMCKHSDCQTSSGAPPCYHSTQHIDSDADGPAVQVGRVQRRLPSV